MQPANSLQATRASLAGLETLERKEDESRTLWRGGVRSLSSTRHLRVNKRIPRL